MGALGRVQQKASRPSSARKRVEGKILRFSVCVGLVGASLAIVAYIGAAYPSVIEWRENNLHALGEITCSEATCDTSKYSTDVEWGDPDYVIDAQTRYFIDVATATGGTNGRFEPLNYSDVSFLAEFLQPASYNTPDREIWRMYSESVRVRDGRNLLIAVGYSMKASNKAVETPASLTADVDSALRVEADKIAHSLSASKVALRSRGAGFAADGFQVVDLGSQKVVQQGPWLPAFLPARVRLPAPGLTFYVANGSLYLAQTNTSGRLLATSFVTIASLRWVGCWSALGFLLASTTANLLSRRFLRNYFSVAGIRVPSLEQAQRDGEGQSVEFKRGLSENEERAGTTETDLLRSVVAFANTNDGVIFLGVDDAGHIKGLALDYSQRDRLERKIHELIRARIRPVPPVQVTFEDLRGLVIARIAVARGDAPLYMMGGTIYIRRGSADVQAQPEDAVRLVEQYAF